MPKQANKIKLSSLNEPHPGSTKSGPLRAGSTGSRSTDRGTPGEPEAAAPSSRAPLLPGGPMLWCLVGLAIGLTIWLGGRAYLKQALADQLAGAATEDVAIQSIDALLRLDANATVEVSRGLAHPEFMVANAAFRALGGQLDAWSKLEPADRLARMQKVVVELERIPTDIDQDHRILVSGLASRIYADTLSNREVGAGDVLEACRRILAANGQPETAPTRIAQLDRLDTGLPDPSPSPLPLPSEAVSPVPPPLIPLRQPVQPETKDEPRQSSPSETQTNVSQQIRSMNRLSVSDIGSSTDPSSRLEPNPRRGQLVNGPAELPQSTTNAARVARNSLPRLETVSEPDPLSSSESSRSRTIPLDVEPLPGSTQSQATQSQTGQAQTGQAEDSPITLSGIELLQIDQLVRLLSSVQPRVRQAAALTLRERGMPEQSLKMATKLANGSVKERLEVLEELDQRDDLDIRPWLLWMAAEGEEPVRQQAVAMLQPIAGNDIDVRRQLRLLLNKERDEKVAQTIRQILMK